MNFLDLECFLVAAEESSFTRAARRLYISQQSLSAHIQKLEKHYQTALFERTVPLTLTPAGRYLFEHSKTLMTLKDHIEEDMKGIHREEENLLHVGGLANRGTVMIEAVLPKVRQAHPEISMKITEVVDDKVSTALHSGMFDLLLGHKMESPAVTFVPLLVEEYYFLIPHAILRQCFDETQRNMILSANVLPISVVQHCPFLASNKVTWFRDVFEAFCRENDVVPNIVVETSSILTRLSLCAAGVGIMPISGSLLAQCHSVLSQTQMEKIHAVKMDYKPDSTYRLMGINYLTQKRLSTASRKFIRIAQETFHMDELQLEP